VIQSPSALVRTTNFESRKWSKSMCTQTLYYTSSWRAHFPPVVCVCVCGRGLQNHFQHILTDPHRTASNSGMILKDGMEGRRKKQWNVGGGTEENDEMRQTWQAVFASEIDNGTSICEVGYEWSRTALWLYQNSLNSILTTGQRGTRWSEKILRSSEVREVCTATELVSCFQEPGRTKVRHKKGNNVVETLSLHSLHNSTAVCFTQSYHASLGS
jgi:hypothetical protein